jgi:murein L,D-transpeptidase YcbB/YkuD
MSRLIACLATGALLALSTQAAVAQEAVTVNGVEAMRVVIAPPETDVAKLIKAKLSAAYYKLDPSNPGYEDAQKLYYFYGARHFEPIWLSRDANGQEAYSLAALKITGIFKDAAAEGFRPSDYLTPAIDVSAAGNDPTKLAALETAFSQSVIRYAHDLYMGRVPPQDVSNAIDPETKHLDAADVLVKLAQSDDPQAIFATLEPPEHEFAELKAALARYDEGQSAPAPVVIPPGPMLKPGMTDPRVALLRQRLKVPAAVGDPDVYDSDLETAVEAFQAQAGKSVDGLVGPSTLAALNGAPAPKITRDDIIANMERWRWLPHDLGAFHVMVNIPQFRVAVVDGDREVYSTKVVVGKPSTPTPIFSNTIRNIVVNPYWNVPASIVAKEIVPHMLANPGYLASQDMQVVDNGQVIDASAVDWASVTQSNWHYLIRQLPGSYNALGEIKFLFPNPHDVYLHDTPEKSLFGSSVRAFSHGCVRVQNPMDFANALLEDEPGLTVDDLEAMFGKTERWVTLKTHVPVHIAYFTVRADADGTLHSYGDIYGQNARLIGLLNGTAKPAAPTKTPIISGV